MNWLWIPSISVGRPWSGVPLPGPARGRWDFLSGDLIYWGLGDISKRCRLWKRASVSIEVPLGIRGGLVYRGLLTDEGGLWKRSVCLYGSGKGDLEERLLYWWPLRIYKGRLWKWPSLSIRTPLEKLERGLFTGDFERRAKVGSRNAAPLSMGALRGVPGGRAPLLGT